jgi:hypothetical protein
MVDNHTISVPSAYSVEEFARDNGISRYTVYREINDGKLVARRVRGKTIVTAEDAAAWRQCLPKVQPSELAGAEQGPERAA